MTTPDNITNTYSFDLFYNIYPKKEGKTAGMKKLHSTIKSEADYIKFGLAVKNYCKLIEIRGTNYNYIKMWSTFCNNWRDYENASDYPELRSAVDVTKKWF